LHGSSIGWVIPTAWGWTQHQAAARAIGSLLDSFLFSAAAGKAVTARMGTIEANYDADDAIGRMIWSISMPAS
jgi:hypothetical protein